MMSNLSQRVQKSKSLKWNTIPSVINDKVGYGTTSHNHTHSYQVYLTKARETSPFGDKKIAHDTITVTCIRCHQPVSDCPGNSNSTICYHGLGAVRHHLAQKNATISFCQTIFDAIKLRKPGQSLVKIVSAQGQAILWGVVGDKRKKCTSCGKLLSGHDVGCLDCSACADQRVGNLLRLQEQVNLLRGSKEETEGID